ncbi:ATP-binding protein [Gillisia sp. Q332]|uniref:ATP-binding protein n=1 Tax=Gillisia xinjiangensis TaxID=3384765 RepID=UPI003918E443
MKLTALASHLETTIAEAKKESTNYLELINRLMKKEVAPRGKKNLDRCIVQAPLPMSSNLDLYDFSVSNSLEKQHLNQLRELQWLEQNINIILLGPSGVGKTYLAAGMCFDAVDKGYRVYFKSMEKLTKNIEAQGRYKNCCSAIRTYSRTHTCWSLMILRCSL